jgi:hypothetical protein
MNPLSIHEFVAPAGSRDNATYKKRDPLRIALSCRFCCSLSVLVLGVNALRRRGVCASRGQSVRADSQPYLGPRSGVAPERRHDG